MNARFEYRAAVSNLDAVVRVCVTAGPFDGAQDMLVPASKRRDGRPQGPRLHRRGENRQSLGERGIEWDLSG